MRVLVALAVVLCGGLLSGCGGATDATSTGRAPTLSVAEAGCPKELKLGEDASISWSPVADKLAVSSSGTIWALDTDTCETSKVTTGEEPDWSPDGQKLVLERDRGLFTASADGSNVRQITATEMEGDSDSSPAWSPSGNLIAFTQARDLSDTVILSLAVVRSDGAGERTVADLGASPQESRSHTAPTWSPDGRWIAWLACDFSPSARQPCLIDLHGQPKIFKVAPPVTDANVYDPSWAPDGTRIAFGRYLNVDEWGGSAAPGELTLVAATGGRARPLLRRPSAPGWEGDSSPSWSGDGRWIAFVREGGDEGGIYVVRPAGSGLRRLTAPAPAAK